MAKYADKEVWLHDGTAGILRSCAPSDAAAFVDFHAAIARESHFTMQRPEDPATLEKSTKRFTALRDDPEAVQLGVFVGDLLLGIAGLHSFWPGHPWVMHSRSFGMMVRQAYWGSGVAKLLVEGLFDFARAHNVRRIEGRVRMNNPRGIRFYERMGFVQEGTHRMGAIIDGQEIAEMTIAWFSDAR